jgi:hypothetical protein
MKVLDIINESMTWSDATPGVAKWMKRNARRAAAYEKRIMEKWGYKVRGLLFMTGLTVPCLQFAGRVMALEDIAGLSDAEFTQVAGVPATDKAKWVSETRDLMWSLFTVQILLPVIYIVVKKLPVVSHLLAILAGSAGVLFSRKGQAFVIGTKLVEQSALVALMVWLGTEEGAKWVANSIIGPLMMPVGKIETSAWDFISKKFFDVTGITPPEKSNVAKEVEKNAGPETPTATRAQIQAADDAANAEYRLRTV